MNLDPTASLGGILARLAESSTDEEAWTALYRLMWPFVIAILYRRLRGAGGMAEDACQEVFFRLARSRPFAKVRDPEEFRAYLWRVSDNVARTYLQHFLRQRDTEAQMDITATGEVPSVQQSSPEEDVDLKELVRNLLLQLDAKDRQLIGLLIQGHNLPDIVKATGLSYTNAGVRLHRLRRKLGKYLNLKGFLTEDQSV